MNKEFLAPLILLLLDYDPSPIMASIQASRTTCVSPCTVVFSAENTVDKDKTSSQAFKELAYYFDFSDPESGTYSVSGKSKNSQIGGPVAAHTFMCATDICSYNVGVRAQNTSGDFDDAFVTINVHSPTMMFDAVNTICVSNAVYIMGICLVLLAQNK